jgi:hypothetical protein
MFADAFANGGLSGRLLWLLLRPCNCVTDLTKLSYSLLSVKVMTDECNLLTDTLLFEIIDFPS